MKKKNIVIVSLVVIVLIAGTIVAVHFFMKDPYKKKLREQGFTAMKHPRTAMGAGTIFTVSQGGTELIKTAPGECFRDIEQNLVPNNVTLLNSLESSALTVDLGSKYLPISDTEVAGALGFNGIKRLDVKFGATRADVLTVEGFAQYLDGKRITDRCLSYLVDPHNLVILSAAQVESMTYQFQGDRKVGGHVDLSALEEMLKAKGVTRYSSIGDNGFTISQPMYIGYQAFRFEYLGLRVPEGGIVTLSRARFALRQQAAE